MENEVKALTVICFILIAIILVIIGCVVMSVKQSGDDFPNRKIRKLLTPICRECVWHFIDPQYGIPCCRCPKALTYYEKTHGHVRFDEPTRDIRGTRLCKFKSVEEAKNEKLPIHQES